MNPWINFWKSGQKGTWDTSKVDTNLIRLFPKARHVLELGCGSGTNAVWMSDQNTSVTAVDISPDAIDLARQKSKIVNWRVLDILEQDIPYGYDFIYDRGTFHMFLSGGLGPVIAEKIKNSLFKNGLWLSVIVKEKHEDYYTINQIIQSIEPFFRIELIQPSTTETLDGDRGVWVILSRRR